MRISLLCPTRGRPDKFEAMVASAAATATQAHADVEVAAYIDDDDPAWGRYRTIRRDLPISFMVGPRCVLSDAWNRAGARSRSDIVMMAADDLRFCSPGWDDMVLDATTGYPDGIVLIYGRDGHADERMATHPFVTRRWIDVVGRFTAPYFVADYCDLWLHEVAKKVDRAVYLPELLVSHLHPSFGLGEWDQTHKERMDRAANEDLVALWDTTETEREMEANRLTMAIKAAA